MAGCCCGETRGVEELSSADLLCGNEGSWSVVRCEDCGLRRTEPRPPPEELAAHYPAEYHPHTAADPPSSARGDALRRFVLASIKGYPGEPGGWRWLGALLGRVFWRRFLGYPEFRAGGHLLDIGCGGGYRLEVLRGLGWSVTGVDFSGAAVERVRQRGIEAIQGTAGCAALAGRLFDAVTFFSSLEHVPDPLADLRAVHKLLRPGGQLIVEVPRIDSWLARVAGPHWFALDLPRHLYHFTPDSLGRLLARAGFTVTEVRSVQPVDDVVFSWIYRTRRADGGRAPLVASRLQALVARMLAAGAELAGAGDTMYVNAVRRDG